MSINIISLLEIQLLKQTLVIKFTCTLIVFFFSNIIFSQTLHSDLCIQNDNHVPCSLYSISSTFSHFSLFLYTDVFTQLLRSNLMVTKPQYIGVTYCWYSLDHHIFYCSLQQPEKHAFEELCGDSFVYK